MSHIRQVGLLVDYLALAVLTAVAVAGGAVLATDRRALVRRC